MNKYKNTDIFEKFTKIKKIGKGIASKVYLVREKST